MRKLKLQMQTSVDGFVAGPNGEMDWMTWTWEERVAKPDADRFTHLMVDTPKIVFSRTLTEVKGKNTGRFEAVDRFDQLAGRKRS